MRKEGIIGIIVGLLLIAGSQNCEVLSPESSGAKEKISCFWGFGGLGFETDVPYYSSPIPTIFLILGIIVVAFSLWYTFKKSIKRPKP